MAVEVILPRVDMDMTEGKIALWHVRSGDVVAKGQVVFEMETDKATMEVEAPADGAIRILEDELNVAMPVGKVVAWILQAGESLPANDGLSAPSPAQAATPLEVSPVEEGDAAQAVPAPTSAPDTGLRATPLARSIARERGIDLAGVNGSGERGRIYAADLVHAAAAADTPTGNHDALHAHWFARHAGIPLVLLHGFGADLGSWRPLVGQLGGVPVLGVDLPNHGKSARVAIRGFAELADKVLARLDGEGVGPVHLLGHSLGGGAALAMAGLLKDRLRSLTLLAPVGLGPEINGAFIQGLLRATREESLRPWMAQLFGNAALLSGSFVATAWQQLRSEEKRSALAQMADVFFPDGTQAELLRDRLAALRIPAKLVWGTLDRVIPVRHACGLPGRVGLHSLEGVGHLPHVEAPALLSDLVRQQIAAAGTS